MFYDIWYLTRQFHSFVLLNMITCASEVNSEVSVRACSRSIARRRHRSRIVIGIVGLKQVVWADRRVSRQSGSDVPSTASTASTARDQLRANCPARDTDPVMRHRQATSTRNGRLHMHMHAETYPQAIHTDMRDLSPCTTWRSRPVLVP